MHVTVACLDITVELGISLFSENDLSFDFRLVSSLARISRHAWYNLEVMF